MIHKKIKAFTLVEVLIVVVILSILATIGFVSMSGYVKKSKFATNEATLRNVEKGITTQYAKISFLPTPDDVFSTGIINIDGGPMNILWSGYVGKNVSQFAGVNEIPKNSLNGELIFYGISSNKKYFQIGLLQPQSVGGFVKNIHAQNEIMKVSGNYSYPLVISDKIINVPSLLLENSSGTYISTSSIFLVNNEPKGTGVTKGLTQITGKSGLTLTGIVLEDWRIQSGAIATALGYDTESAGIKVFGAKKYYNTIVNQPALPILPVFSSSSTIGEVKTVNGTKVVFAGSQSGTLYMTHPSCGNVSGTGAFIHNCSGTGCMSSLFTQAKNGDYSGWNLNCDGSLGDIYMRWKGSAPAGEFNCGGNDIICNSFTNGYQNTLDMITAFSAYDVFNTPANFCKNLRIGGYDDWYLPSRGEMLLLYQNKNLIGNFYPQTYLTSTEYAGNTSYFHFVSMNNGSSNYTFKYTNFGMRCIRKVNN